MNSLEQKLMEATEQRAQMENNEVWTLGLKTHKNGKFPIVLLICNCLRARY
jgi:hypothetical protein